MNERMWERIGAASGLLSAALLAAAVLVLPSTGGVGSTAAIIRYFADYSVQVRVSLLLVLLAMVVFLWFVGHLRHVLQRAEGGAEAFSPVVLGAGVALSAVGLLSVVPGGALAYLAQGPQSMMAGDVARSLIGARMFSGAALELLIALFTGAAGLAMVRRELAGRWLGWFGLAVAVIGLIAGVATAMTITVSTFAAVMSLLTFATFVLWLATASVVMVVRPEVERTPAERSVFAH